MRSKSSEIAFLPHKDRDLLDLETKGGRDLGTRGEVYTMVLFLNQLTGDLLLD